MKKYVFIAAFALTVALANILTDRYGFVNVGLGLSATAGTFAAGFALLFRDFVQRLAGNAAAWAAIVLGAGLSWVTSDARLALASAGAFFVSEAVDFVAFSGGRRRLGFSPAAFSSNVVSAPVDTVAFLTLAGFPLTVDAFAGQAIGKLVWATALPLAVIGVVFALLRQPLDPVDPFGDERREVGGHSDAEAGQSSLAQRSVVR